MCPNLAQVIFLCSCLCFAELSDVLGLAVHGSYIYWTDRGNSQQPLGRADKHNGQHSEALLVNINGFQGLVAVNKSADPGWTVIKFNTVLLFCWWAHLQFNWHITIFLCCKVHALTSPWEENLQLNAKCT